MNDSHTLNKYYKHLDKMKNANGGGYMVWLTNNSTRKVLAIFLTIVFMGLSGCGGGGGGGGGVGGGNPGGAASSFTAVASAGELLTYTVDFNSLTYSYVITDSAYGLNGVTGSGTLISNGDGTYRPSGYNARIKILPNGILIGAILENFGAGPEVVPIIGLDNPTSSISTLASVYNFVSLGCDLAACGSNYGTFKINSNNTWESCAGGDIKKLKFVSGNYMQHLSSVFYRFTRAIATHRNSLKRRLDY
jgi:hypothetical protein